MSLLPGGGAADSTSAYVCIKYKSSICLIPGAARTHTQTLTYRNRYRIVVRPRAFDRRHAPQQRPPPPPTPPPLAAPAAAAAAASPATYARHDRSARAIARLTSALTAADILP